MFIFLIAIVNLGLRFSVAVVIKRRCDGRIAKAPTTGQAKSEPQAEPDLDQLLGSSVDEVAEEAIEAVEDLLTQAGLQPIATGDDDPPSEDEDDAEEADAGEDDAGEDEAGEDEAGEDDAGEDDAGEDAAGEDAADSEDDNVDHVDSDGDNANEDVEADAAQT